jgi:hypothetical protein
LFVSLGCNANGLPSDELYNVSCENISAKSFQSNVEVLGNIDNHETYVVSSNSHLADIFAKNKNETNDIGPYSYQVINRKSIKNIVPNSHLDVHNISNKKSSYLEHEIMIGAP